MPQNIVKTIVNTFYVESVSHPHNQRYRGDAQAVNDALVPLEADTDAWHSRKVAACRAAYPYDHDKCLRLRQERSIPFRVNSRRRRSVQRLALFHYVTRSTEDFRRKVARGGGMGNSRTWTEFDKLNRCGTAAAARAGTAAWPVSTDGFVRVQKFWEPGHLQRACKPG